MKIRTARPDDAAAVQAIYAPCVRDTPISFETEVPTVDEMRRRIDATLPHFPWMVAEADGGQVAGYAYAGRYAERAAYRWATVVTVYVHADHRGRGVGRALYGRLLPELAALGYCQAYAGITQPNAPSVALHEAVGFTPVGVFHNAGYKLGRWHGVGYWQKTLQAPPVPSEPRAFSG